MAGQTLVAMKKQKAQVAKVIEIYNEENYELIKSKNDRK